MGRDVIADLVARSRVALAQRQVGIAAEALRRTAENEAHFETQKIHLEAVSLERKSEAESVAEKLAGRKCILLRQASDTGRLYGSVNSGDLAQAVTEAGFSNARKQIRLTATLKTTGTGRLSKSRKPAFRRRSTSWNSGTTVSGRPSTI